MRDDEHARGDVSKEDPLIMRIWDDIQAIENTLAKVIDLQPELREDEHYLAAMARYIMDLHTGFERVMQTFLKLNGMPIPSGDKWHKDLLELFINNKHHDLPELVKPEVADDMKELLGFRHIGRNHYADELDVDLVEQLIPKARIVAASFLLDARKAAGFTGPGSS